MTFRRTLAHVHTFRIPWIAMALVAAAASWAAAESAALYLRVRSTPVRSKPSLKDGGQEAVLYAGQQVQVLERSKDGDWVKVRFTRADESKSDHGKAEAVTEKGLKEGWVHATLLGEAPPGLEAKDAAWLSAGGEAFKKARTDVSDGYAKARKVGPGVLAELDGRYPNAEELDKFLREGQLGLYRPDWPSQEGGVTK
ncbi:MAG: SH3 domain-containing protein [Planctomycetota bacterium]|nr:SH3 domain-containing protein [Planctomycetota bacterium]